MTQAHPTWIGHTIADRYKIESLLGQGGMSTVYKATDINLRRTVAVKLIHPHLSNNDEFVQRFELEAEAVAQLHHANIIQVYDFAHDGQIYYMVLRYIPGETLQDKLKSATATNQRLPLAETIRIMATIGEAVSYAHQQSMIHRDLKPSNVILDDDEEPVLMDFGVAKMVGGVELTRTGTVMGSAAYMSPEQAQGQRTDERADIYSLGIMLYEMTTGKPPFEGNSEITIMMKHMTEPLPDIRERISNVPDTLAAIIEKALAKDPADRYQTTVDLVTDLRAIKLIPVAQTPVSPDITVPKPTPKPNRLAQAVGIFAVLLLAGLGLYWALTRSAPATALPTQEIEIPASSSFEGMAKIGSDTYEVGSSASGSQYVASQTVALAEFWIDRYEVTNAGYAEFMTETGRTPPLGWADSIVSSDQADHPVSGLTWDDAAAYCTWSGKRLPTEAEWEVAARGSEGLQYPWGNELSLVALPGTGTYRVGSIDANQSPFGVFDMAGNVWEWIGDTYAPVAEGHRVLRGGENSFLKDMAFRLAGDPNTPTLIDMAGVRCAAS